MFSGLKNNTFNRLILYTRFSLAFDQLNLVLDTIKKKIFDQKLFFDKKIVSTKNLFSTKKKFLTKIFFSTKNFFLTKNCFRSKKFVDQKFFLTKFFFTNFFIPKIFLTQIFLKSKICFDQPGWWNSVVCHFSGSGDPLKEMAE